MNLKRATKKRVGLKNNVYKFLTRINWFDVMARLVMLHFVLE